MLCDNSQILGEKLDRVNVCSLFIQNVFTEPVLREKHRQMLCKQLLIQNGFTGPVLREKNRAHERD